MSNNPAVTTVTGVQFTFLAPTPDMFRVIDIATGLSHQCRFAGQVNRFYSVAEHSVLVSKLVPEEYAMAGLFHDAAEAYMNDIPSPIKRQKELRGYCDIENHIQKQLFMALKIDPVLPMEVHEADHNLVATEAMQLQDPTPAWVWERDPYILPLHFWSPEEAKQKFLDRFVEISFARAGH